MKRYIEGEETNLVTLLSDCLDDFIAQDYSVRVVDAFIGELNMVALGFAGLIPACTGRPSYSRINQCDDPKTHLVNAKNAGIET